MLPIDTLSNNVQNNMDYKSNLEKALFGELDAVAKYRKILGTMPSGSSYTLLMSIMTDELRHASKYNFLIHNTWYIIHINQRKKLYKLSLYLKEYGTLYISSYANIVKLCHIEEKVKHPIFLRIFILHLYQYIFYLPIS